MGQLQVLPCLDSKQLAEDRRRELNLTPESARNLGLSALQILRTGEYQPESGRLVVLRHCIAACRERVVSIRPDDPLPQATGKLFEHTRVQVRNQTTLGAARDLGQRGQATLALNFANGLQPGGGFLGGARAQEESLCRSSALFVTLKNDPMYAFHWERGLNDSTDWAILSPGVPVFRGDDGALLETPWKLDFLTCAAPYVPDVGQPRAGELLERRIHRVLSIARSWHYTSLVLGAWGCGEFGNDPERTARDFRAALETDFDGVFEDVVFAITDWSPNRRRLGPFRDVFAGQGL